VIPLLYPALCTSRAASLNSAIHHGIRRSKGVGFRGKERSGDDTGSSGKRDGPDRWSEQRFRRSTSRPQLRATESESRPSTFSRGNRSAADKPRESTNPFVKKSFGKEGNSALGRPTARLSRHSDGSSSSTGDNERSSRERSSRERGFGERLSNDKKTYPSLSSRKIAYGSPSRTPYDKENFFSDENTTKEYRLRERTSRSKDDTGRATRQHGSQERRFGSEEERARPSRFESASVKRDDNQLRVDSRMPISIPYTTPASEFLYGTSVVEAALRSRRVPRRKHYKLYIYNGDNREGASMERDASLERLAAKSGVETVRVSGDWLRVMDKMSGGRPHNGYILEASPLPRQPIASLGRYTSTDGQSGFEIVLDHQSREEAAVNGTDDLIKYSTNVPGRKPLVLLLDSIVDPGNLGGIIRTASFLGVTAIAVSTRNSASFTSVVLKASAGASENVTLFSVNKPAGFLVDSKAAGWKIFAAVAPSDRRDPEVPESMTTDELEDPLSEDPCILMLGGEGEGLRKNLRSKADVNLSIRGSGRSHNVDSLNVSVAAGILCNSFLKRRNEKLNASPTEDARAEVNSEPVGDLF
jgi:21S rRNA (GM2251-2'-O)-methyltransferase